MLRIFSWNVNGIRACGTKGLFDWLSAESPDMLCLQETKAQVDQMPKEFMAPSFSAPASGHGKSGLYHSYWFSAKRRGYSGVGLYSKKEPLSVRPLDVGEFDDEGRTLIADFGDFCLISAYFPNSQDAGKRIDYKLRYCDAVLKECGRIVKKGGHVIVAGDYNIAHEAIDLANPETNEGNAGYLPAERAWFDKWVAAGYVDSFRHLCKEPKHYSWWSYRAKGARERNVGWRLDYHCVDGGFLPAVKKSLIHPEVMGSDHCPVEIQIEL